MESVLIDTWWNVNTEETTISSDNNSSFNRYMVECESTSLLLPVHLQFVLIDTWWNVNSQHVLLSRLPVPGFNRYMVECE